MQSKETKHQIVNGDSRNMDFLRDKSVELIITSPPYWQLIKNRMNLNFKEFDND